MIVELLHVLGNDDMVVDAARVSFDKYASQYTTEQNGKLIRYLAKHGHWTPFGHPQVQFRVTVPIFVARQWHRHTVGHVMNEISRRYVDDEPAFFTPTSWRGKPTGGAKQGSTGTVEDQERWDFLLSKHHNHCISIYRQMLDRGIAPEQARMVLPQTMYTSWIDTGSLAFWARFFVLRADTHAQEEIRQCAYMIGNHMLEAFPVSWPELTEKAS